MSTQITNVNKVNAGLCPHGLPPGACPICSKMGGGGSLRVGERAQKAGEMSYHQCAMIGNMMRARELAEKRQAQSLEKHAEALKAFETAMQRISNNLQNFSFHQIRHSTYLEYLFLDFEIVEQILEYFAQNLLQAKRYSEQQILLVLRKNLPPFAE